MRGVSSPAEPSDETARTPWRDQPSWIRWTAYVAVGLVVLLVGLAVLGFTAVRRSLPQTTGSISVPGLKHEVTVLRDDAGVPQIYADRADDLFFAQGYVQAQDRFFEMDVRRHLTSGRLSEMFGEDALETDKLVRTMGWRRVAEQELSRLSPEATGYLESFSAGVNAYLHEHAPNEVSLEYTLLSVGGLDYRIEDWTPADSVAWLKAMAWDLRGNMQDEIDRAMAAPHVSGSMLDELYPPYPYATRQPIVPEGSVVRGRFVAGPGPAKPAARPPLPPAVVDQLAALDRAVVDMPALVGRGNGIGSNAWVVDGEHSTTGQPILANDPHLAPSLPGVWYQMGLHCNEVTPACPFDVSGFTFSGFPGVVIGHNQQIAWGFTNLGPDVSDLYLEAVDGERYKRGKAWLPFKRRTETIEIDGEDPFTFTVRSTVHGPVLSDVSSGYSSVGANAPTPRKAPDRGTGYAVALAWTALQPSRTAQAVFEIDAATSWKEFRAGARHFAAPAQNMVYADRAGHIGYQAPGRIPMRGPANDGDYPSPGWDKRYDWTGDDVPFDALPTVLDPAEGFIATANQAPVGKGYPYHLGDAWDPGQRSQRIRDLLEQKGTLGVADMNDIQLDVLDPFAPTLVPYLLDVDAGNHYYAGGQQLLRSWDFQQEADSPAAAYYNAVWRNLLHLTFDDELPDSVVAEGGGRWFDVVARLLKEPSDPWWDDTTTETVREDRDDILRRAVRDARDELVRLQSRRPNRWTWGHQHELELRNSTIGQSGNSIGEALLNRGPWKLGGGTGIVDAIGWDASKGYDVDWVPSMRMVVSLADLDESTWVNLTGASGHAFSPHYTDQTELWADGRTRFWAFTRPAVDDSTQDRLTLKPSGGGTIPTG
jgi:penicillin amidase